MDVYSNSRPTYPQKSPTYPYLSPTHPRQGLNILYLGIELYLRHFCACIFRFEADISTKEIMYHVIICLVTIYIYSDLISTKEMMYHVTIDIHKRDDVSDSRPQKRSCIML